jgi:hypothetical protein
MKRLLGVSLCVVSAVLFSGCETIDVSSDAEHGPGPLRPHPDNPRYFAHTGGSPIYLTGSHTWNNVIDMGQTDPPVPLDYRAHIHWLKEYGHNFTRLWTWELLRWDSSGLKGQPPRNHFIRPHRYVRSGPGLAADGRAKFDLTRLNDAYFENLSERVRIADENGIYVSVMLFEGWGNQTIPDAYAQSPFNPANNINNIDGDLDKDGVALEVHQLAVPAITAVQKHYLRRVLEELNHFDNLLYEIGNEVHHSSTEWQYEMIRFIKEYEQRLPKQHPVGMTYQYKFGVNQTLFASSADWISPNDVVVYRMDPPPADGSKVILADTDHFWGVGGNSIWVWKSFFRGLNPIFMDPLDGSIIAADPDKIDVDAIRRSMGQAHAWSERIHLATMEPHGEMASSTYCLADPGNEYLVLVPERLTGVSVELPEGEYRFLWYDTQTASETEPKSFRHPGGPAWKPKPYAADSVLHVVRIGSHNQADHLNP